MGLLRIGDHPGICLSLQKDKGAALLLGRASSSLLGTRVNEMTDSSAFRVACGTGAVINCFGKVLAGE